LTTLIAFGVSAAFLLSLVPDGRSLHNQASQRSRVVRPEQSAAAHAAGGGAVNSPQPEAPLPASGDDVAARRRRATNAITVEKDGRAREISVDDIFAVRANAHYSYVHDGEQEYFCGLAISAIEARLDPARFLRVHRSHIVAIDRVASLRRAGENGVAELAAPVRCSIPVARSHFRQVKQLVEARMA